MNLAKTGQLVMTAILIGILATACSAKGSGESGTDQLGNSPSSAATVPSNVSSPSSKPAAQASAAPAGSVGSVGTVEIAFPFTRQDGIATNQFAVWIESAKGEFVKTVFATHFIATGGYKLRPEAIPTWVKRSGLASASYDEVDAIAGATLKTGDATFTWNCTDSDGIPVPAGSYRFYVEGTTRWENRILYEGTIEIGSGRKSAEAKVSESTDQAIQSGMIGQVSAVYTP
ncbi:DUF2271 domain-containing protein [Gorillibacterium timonense]|uniref:DUF2271 domain-containing protein n=1 Tax=Gorillibacterium timonense TaxID=1689269 RepID=UPI00071D9192|nr:DUF2271 domain-containing protein [Gorillibacterium timonense]